MSVSTSNENLGFHARMSQLELRLKERSAKINIAWQTSFHHLCLRSKKRELRVSKVKISIQNNDGTVIGLYTRKQQFQNFPLPRWDGRKVIKDEQTEDERFKLEERFNQLLRTTKSEESKQLFRLRENYCQLLERDRLRCERNDLILRTLNRIENRTSMLTAKTDRLRLLRPYYESFMGRQCSDWKRSDMKYSNVLGSMNDLTETSPSLRPLSPLNVSVFSTSPVPLFTSTPSTTRRSSLVIPDLDLESLKYKCAHEVASSTFPTRRKLFGDYDKSLSNKVNPDSKAHTENIEATNFCPNIKSKDFSKDGTLQPSPSTLDLEQRPNRDFLQLPLTDHTPSFLPKSNTNINSLKVDTMKQKTNYLSNLHSPNTECKQNPSIFGDNKSAKSTARTSAKPLTKSSSFNVSSSYLNRPDRYFPTERRSNLIRRPTFAYQSTTLQPSERPLSSEGRMSHSAAYNRSKSPLRVVDDIFKKYLINYDKRYLSDPISESKYGKYLYPSKNYEISDKPFTSVRNESPKHLFDSNYNDFEHVHNKKELYPSTKDSFKPNHYDSYGSYEPAYKSVSKSNFSGLDVDSLRSMDSPRSTYSNDWKDWDHYRNRYDYTADDDMRSFHTGSNHVENVKYPKYVNRTTFEDRDPVPHICVDSSNINYLDRIDHNYKPFDFQTNKHGDFKTIRDQNESEKGYSYDNYSSLGVDTINSHEQTLKVKDSTKAPQTPKKVSFSNEFLYDRFDIEPDSPEYDTISQNTDKIYSKSVEKDDPIRSNDSNYSSKSFGIHDRRNDIKANGNLSSYENEINISNSLLESTVPISPNWSDKELVESNLNLIKDTNSSINTSDSKLIENQMTKNLVVGTTEIESCYDKNVTDLSESGIEATRDITVPKVLGIKGKSDIKDNKDLNQVSSNEFLDSNIETIQRREAVEANKDFNEEVTQNQGLGYAEQSYEDKPKVEGDQENAIANNNTSSNMQNYLPQEHQTEISPKDEIIDFVNNDSIHQTYDDVDSQKVLKQYEEHNSDNINKEGYQGVEQNTLYDDVNANKNTLQENHYEDRSNPDNMDYGDTNLTQYNSNYDEAHYDSSQPQYEQTKGYDGDKYTEDRIPEYGQEQSAYGAETYTQENAPQSYQKLPEVYDNQYSESAYEQPAQEGYRQDYEQPVEEQYSTGYRQEQHVQDYERKDEEHFSPSHYQQEPGREYPAEQYKEEYPQQSVHYEKDYQNPVEESNQQFEANYDPTYQKEPQYVYDNPESDFDPTVPTEPYDQYDQQQYAQYDQQSELDQYKQRPQVYDQYDQQSKDYDGYQQQPQQYDMQPKEYGEYEQPPQHYDQQPNEYNEYEQPQQYDQQPQQYDQQPQQYDQPPQQYDQPSQEYDGYVEQAQPYIPYDQEQQQEPNGQYDQGDPGNYDQYEQQQKEQYGSQYQGEPDQFGNYDYGYDGQGVKTDQDYRGDEQLAYTDQPQTYVDNLQHSETVQQDYDRSDQLPYGANIQSSYEELQQNYSENQLKYEDEKRSYEDLNRAYQEPLPQTDGVTVPLSKPESVHDPSAGRVYSETVDSKAAPNLNRVLESDSESVRAQDTQETHENSSDFDFSSGPK